MILYVLKCGVEEDVIFPAIIYEVLSRLSGLSVICSLWKESIDWLEVGLFNLMVSVTVFGVRSYVPPIVCFSMV